MRGEPGPETHRDSPEQTRIRELEGTVKLLERRVEEEKKTAREQGHHQGLAAGAQQEAAKWTGALERLVRSVEELSKSKARFRAEVEDDAVKLALAIARKVLNRELASDPEALVGLARVALDKLNLRELQRVRVHPGDAKAIERLLTASACPKRVEVVSDGTLERGAAIFEAERGTLDASVTTQLGEIERGLADMLGRPSK
jgi:flagellar assembly protein FliH